MLGHRRTMYATVFAEANSIVILNVAIGFIEVEHIVVFAKQCIMYI